MKFNSLFNTFLFKIFNKEIIKNKSYKDIHKGESCYIFGNGISIKYYNLKNFSDRVSIGCGLLFLHQDFKDLQIKYYYEGHPFLFYPYWFNQYNKKLEKNILGRLYKKNVLLNKNIDFFFSISNYFGFRSCKNIHYIHHFDKQFSEFPDCKLDGYFPAMSSALSGMLGMALYMGFKDITLVGCDYTFYPKLGPHFYEYGKPDLNFDDSIPNEEFLIDAKKSANITTITPDETCRGRMLDHISYSELTGSRCLFRENNEILLHSDLLCLNKSKMLYKIFP